MVSYLHIQSFKTLILEEVDTKNLRMISVDMQEPQSRSQNSPLKFLASLALSLQVHVKAFNFEDLSSLLVQVRTYVVCVCVCVSV